MMKSMKKMLLMATIAVMVVSLAAAPAMAHNEAQDHQNDPSATSPVVHDHRDGSSSGTADEEPLKDPGIRLCDITPTDCDNTDDSKDEKPLKDPGIRLCDIVPTECQNTEDSKDDHIHNVGVHPEANDPNPVKEEDTPSSEGNTTIIADCIDPDTHQRVVCDSKDDKEKGQKDTVSEATQVEKLSEEIATASENDASSAAPKPLSTPDEAGQIANSDPDIQGGCPFDYDYDEDLDVCVPSLEDFDFFPILSGDKPWPDTAGGYVTLPGEAGGDLLIGLGGIISGFGGMAEKALDWYGEDGGPIGWGFQGLGQTIGFATEVAGTIVSGAGEIVGGVSDAVGDAVDAVGDAAEEAWDGITGGWW